MTTVGTLTQATYIGSYEDRMSGPADKSRQALDALGNAVEVTDTKVTRASGSWDSYIAKAAGASTLASQICRAERDLANAVTARDNEIAKGNTTLEQSASTMAVLQGRVDALREKWNQLTQATAAANEPTLRLYDTMQKIAAQTQATAAIQEQFNNVIRQSNQRPDQLSVPDANYAARAADIQAYGAALDSVRAKYDPLFAASSKYSAAVDEIKKSVTTGARTAEQAAVAQENLTAAYAAANEPMDGYLSRTAKLQETLIATARATAQAENAQEAFNRVLGVQSRANSITPESLSASHARASAAVFEEQAAAQLASARAQDQLNASLEATKSKYDPVFAAAQRYTTELKAIDAAEASGALNAKLAGEARITAYQNSNQPIQTLTKTIGQHTEATWQSRFATQQFGVQTIQLFTSIQAGTPILTAMIQQIHQMVDVALSTGTGFEIMGKAIKAAFGAVISPIGLAITYVAALTAIGASAELSARQLANFQNALRATRDDYASLGQAALATAKNVAATTNISTSNAITAARTISSVSNFSGNQQALSDLIKLSNDLAIAMRKTVPEAAKELADAMKDPAAEAQKLSDAGFRGFNQQLADLAKHLQDSGHYAEAFKLVQDGLTASVSGASEPTTRLGKAWEDLSKAFTTAGQNGRSLADVLGTAITTAAAGAIDAITGVINAINRLRETAGTPQQTPVTPQGAAALTPDATGRQVLRNATNGIAMGLMQVIPDRDASGNLTTQRYGYDLRFQDQNIAAGLTDLRIKSAASPGNLDQAVKNFGDGTPSYLAKVKSANIGTLPADVASQIEFWGQVLGLSPELIEVGQRIAVVESQGHQYAAPGVAARQPGPFTEGGGEFPGRVPSAAINILSGPIGGPGDVEKQLNAALAYADSLDTITKKAKALEAEANLLTDALSKPGQSKETYAKLAEALDIVHGRQYANITATQQVNRELAQQTSIMGQDGPAAQKVADTLLHLDQVSLANTGHTASLAEKQAALASVASGLSKELALVVTQTTRQVAANENSVSAVEKGGKALDDYNALVKAQVDALQFGAKGTDAYNTAVAVLTASNRDLAQSQRDVTAAQDIHGFQQENEQIALEADLIGKSTAQINIQTAALKERQKQGLSAGDIGSATQNEAVRMAANTAAFRTQVDQQKQDLNELANSFTSAFDTISQAMVNSFLSGSGAAVNWSNVMKSVVQQVLAEFLKLAILNPLLNSLFGGSRSELGGVFGALLGGGNSGGGLNVLGLGQQALGVGNALSPDGGFLNSLSGGGNTGLFGGAREGISSFLNQGIFGTSTSEAATANFGQFGNAFLLNGGETPGLISASDLALPVGTEGATGLFGGATIGAGLGALGTVGLGYGIGSTIGGLTQKSFNKVGPGPNIGAGIGAVGGLAGGLATGAALGSVVPVIGTIIGAIIGAIAGSAFGPRPPSPYSQTVVGVTQGGRLDIGVTNSQLVDATAERKQAIADISKINAALDATGLSISDIVSNTGPGRHLSVPSGDINALQVGQNSPKGTPDPTKINDLQSGFWKLRFSSQDPDLNEFLQRGGGRGFHSSDELATTVTAIKSFIAATSGTDFASHISATLAQAGQLENVNIAGFLAPIQKFVTETVPALLNVGKVSGSLADAIAGLHAQFDGAIATAHELGYKEQELTAARDKGIQAAYDTATSSIWGPGGIAQTLLQRQRQAQATISGSPADAQYAQLSAFDNQAALQRTQLHDQLVGIYGDSVTTTTWYAGLQAQLETTLGAERLAIQKQANSALVSDAQATANAFALNIAEMQLNVRRETALLALGINNPNPYVPEANGGNITQKSLSLYEFDQVTAPQQREQFKAQLIGWFGDAYKTTADFGAKMNELETTLGAERLALAQKYDDQILQTVSGTVTSLTDYAHSLQTSQASPLSPLAQYDLAQSQFNAVSGAAKAGDYNSIQKLQSYSDALLNASRAVFGSGAGYASDFEKVLDALNLVAQATPDSLTASVYTAETRTQTQVLSDGQTALAGLLQSILTELQQGSSRPARAA